MTASLEPGGLRDVAQRLPLRGYLLQVWQRRAFALAMPLAQIEASNANAALGSLWNILQPLLLAGVYYLLFGVILDARQGIDNYAAFLIAGLFTFYYTQKTVLVGARAITSNERLLRNVKFPRATLPLSATCGQALLHVPAMFAMLSLILVTGEPARWSWILLVPLFVLQTLFNLGAALVMARLTYRFRDIENVLPYVLRIWLYMSVLLFSFEQLPTEPTWVRPLFVANPMFAFVEQTRTAVLTGTTSVGLWLACAFWAVTALVGGLLFFRRQEASYGYR